MGKPISLLILSVLLLTSCGVVRESRLNPFNWFGTARSAPVTEPTESDINPLIPARRDSIFRQERDESYRGTEVAQITALFIERRPGGALVRAEGVTERQGAFDVRLIRLDDESDETTLTYAMRALQQTNTPQGASSTRRVAAVQWLTDNQLSEIRIIRVKGANNVQTSRR